MVAEYLYIISIVGFLISNLMYRDENKNLREANKALNQALNDAWRKLDGR